MENKTLEPLPQILKQKKEDMVFDPDRFIAGFKAVLDQLPEDFIGKKP